MNKETSNGTNFFMSLLTVLFIGLKLGGVIHWSWWWVLSPIWITVAFVLLVFAIGCVVVFIGSRKNHNKYSQK